MTSEYQRQAFSNVRVGSRFALRAATIATVLLTASIGTGYAAETSKTDIPLVHFYKGADFRKFSAHDKTMYLAGYIDAAMLVAQPLPTDGNERWVQSLMKQITLDQALAIVDRAIESQPENWDQPANVLIYNALRNAHNKKRG